jgi:hypothetical protein
MLIVIGLANLLRIAELAQDLVEVSAQDRKRLVYLLRLQSDFMASRLAWGIHADENGRTVTTVDFDPGTWATHPDWSHSADELLRFPAPGPRAKNGVGKDISHGYRIAWLALTLSNVADVGDTVNWIEVVKALANQFAHHVLDTNMSVPRFRNYLDGSNGWYRVNYSNRPGFGYPPYGLSRTYLGAPWSRIAPYNQKLKDATAKLWQALATPSAQQCEELQRTYVNGYVWREGKPLTLPLSGPAGSLALLPFVAVSPIR